jgi:phosphoribosylaminoimidazolecarboxamide formyltransferase/IMP cyclohydrolase
MAPDGFLPLAVLSGSPSYLNLLDALRGWKLVRELGHRFAQPAAASMKHANPAGVALGGQDLPAIFWTTHFIAERSLSPVGAAYLKARQSDRIASYGDFAALSEVVDLATAKLLKTVASDGVIAPGYASDALHVLREKRDGRYIVIAIDPGFVPSGPEMHTEFGLVLRQDLDTSEIPDPLAVRVVSKRKNVSDGQRDALLLAMIVAKHTQSNAVAIAANGQTIGIGAGQQSRISATQLACAKADVYRLLDHPKIARLVFADSVGRIEKLNLVELFIRHAELGETERQRLKSRVVSRLDPITRLEREAWLAQKQSVCLASDAFIPFRDNIDHAARSNITHIMQTGGSLRDAEVIEAADEHGIVMLHSGTRHFRH